MQIKEVKPVNFLFFRTETKVNELAGFVPVAKKLFKESVKLDIHPTGPIHWHYFGFTGDETQSFTLEVALPVATVVNDYDGKFHFKRTEPFKCVSVIHEGGWLDMLSTYAKAMNFISENKLQSVAVNRELYINADFIHPEANVTEIQIGIR